MRKENWEMPETAMVYERSVREARAKESKIPISESSMEIYDDLRMEIIAKMKDLKAEKKKAAQSQLNLLKLLIDHFTVV